MGNQSSRPAGLPPSPVSTERSEKEKKVGRRVSVKAIGAGKATAADPSAVHASATAQNISQPVTQRPIHEQLQAAQSPETSLKPQDKPTKTPLRDLNIVDDHRLEGESRALEHRAKEEKRQEPSVPVDVPQSIERPTTTESIGHAPESSAPNYLADYAKLQRPPRLPLPIAEVDHAPGSPLLAPVAADNEDVSIFEEEAELPRKSSMISSTTVDEEELGDELSGFPVDASLAAKLVPTTVTWAQPGEKVYVTGTFASWDKKYKLHKNKDGPGMAVVLQLPPGTHHVKFIVDGEMKASDHLPTAVDYTNVLVNYIEVNADDISRAKREAQRAAQLAEQPQEARKEDERAESPEDSGDERAESRQEVMEEEILDGDYRQLVPQALVDIDKEEGSDEYRDAFALISETPGPPSLPLFLGRSILNGVLPMKDDTSVLTLPNHTVLNHLATSSIKNNVLATSVTTRYNKKYVTTIMYKPTGLEEKRRQQQEQEQRQQEDQRHHQSHQPVQAA